MKAVEFEAVMGESGQIILPAEYRDDVPTGQQLKIVVMWEAEGADQAWREAGRRRFEDAYSAEDSVYEQLLHGS